jgi:hypothetical protein
MSSPASSVTITAAAIAWPLLAAILDRLRFQLRMQA